MCLVCYVHCNFDTVALHVLVLITLNEGVDNTIEPQLVVGHSPGTDAQDLFVAAPHLESRRGLLRAFGNSPV